MFVIGKKLIDTALQLISGFTEFVNQGGKSEPIKKNGKNQWCNTSMIVVIKKCDGFCWVFEVNVEICTKKTSEFAARFVEGKIVQDKNKNKTTFV